MAKINQDHTIARRTDNNKAVPDVRSCPQCQQQVVSNSRFCLNCGTPLSAEQRQNKDIFEKIRGQIMPQFPLHGCDLESRIEAINSLNEKPAMTKAMSPPADSPNCACGAKLVEDASYCHRCGRIVGGLAKGHYVHWKTAKGAEHVFGPFASDLTIGSDEGCDIVLADDAYASRRHARLTINEGLVLAEDLASSNGTFVRIRRPIILEAGDEVVVGGCHLRIEKTE